MTSRDFEASSLGKRGLEREESGEKEEESWAVLNDSKSVVLKDSNFGKLSVDSVLDSYFAKKKESEEHFQKERESAIKIQKIFRGYVQRKKWWRVKIAALTIERVYKGYKARKNCNRMKIEKKKKDRIDYYNECARKIQALFRGYISRKKKFDFYKRKKFLDDVEEKNEQMKLYVAKKLKEHQLKVELEHKKRKGVLFQRIAPRMHYLVSTQNIAGVLKSPKWKNITASSLRATTKLSRTKIEEIYDDKPFEEALKSTTKRQIEIPNFYKSNTSSIPRVVKANRAKRKTGKRKIETVKLPRIKV